MLNPAPTQENLEKQLNALRDGQAAMLERVRAARENEENHRLITHIIGIERWGQARLTEALGSSPGEREYDSYRPSRDTPWAELPNLFVSTRMQTLDLGQQIQRANKMGMVVEHNDFGPLNMCGWLRYLALHASLESKKLR
ncbi:MAG: hypothetical protein ACOCYT_03060 [Chloroflexota bacterium]